MGKFIDLLNNRLGQNQSRHSILPCTDTDNTDSKVNLGHSVSSVSVSSTLSFEDIVKKHTRIADTTDNTDSGHCISSKHETEIRNWLSHIDESDPDIILEILGNCNRNPKHLEYFLKRAKEITLS